MRCKLTGAEQCGDDVHDRQGSSGQEMSGYGKPEVRMRSLFSKSQDNVHQVQEKLG